VEKLRLLEGSRKEMKRRKRRHCLRRREEGECISYEIMKPETNVEISSSS